MGALMFGFVVAEIVLAVLVGWAAQRWKGRTGALWAVMTFGVQMAALVIVVASVAANPEVGATIEPSSGIVATHLMAMAAGAAMFLVVATLPRRG